jgi:hypothetical protein
MRISPCAYNVAPIPFPDLGEAAGDGAAHIESGEEFDVLDLVEDERSGGEGAGGASGEGSAGPSETHKEVDHTPSLLGSDSSDLNWELDQDDPRDGFFLDAPHGKPNGQGAWKVITPPLVMPMNLGEIEEGWAARVLSEHNRLVGKGGLRRQSAQDLTEADVLDVVLSKAGPALAKALSEPGHDCSDEEVGLFINTALYCAGWKVSYRGECW